jgi:TetR/AcrR family transcriptional regulator, mexJK operon transcriptional repressor
MERVMSNANAGAGAGPRDLAKREAILDAAYGLFLERGIAATTMGMVAERA